jgi:hypothetical protein
MADPTFVLEHHVLVLDATMVRPFEPDKGPGIAMMFLKSLLARLGMEELGPLGMYPATDLRFPGFSFVQPITTSHIAGHYFEEDSGAPHIHMDIYSCKKFDWQDAIGVIHQFIGLADWDATYIIRHRGQERYTYQIMGNGKQIKTLMPLQTQKKKIPKAKSVKMQALELA